MMVSQSGARLTIVDYLAFPKLDFFTEDQSINDCSKCKTILNDDANFLNDSSMM